MDNPTTPPQRRANQIGRANEEKTLRAALAEGALSHGWIISGAVGSGKATLAYRIARGVLAPHAMSDDTSFEMREGDKTFRLIAAGAHPDLFVAEPLWDEKRGKYQTEITIETIRKLTSFLSRTAALGGARVAIIDAADDMNRNAANALLKVLEEPPAGALLLLLSALPGRLLPTIRSRCRRLDLNALSDELVEGLLNAEGVLAKDARSIAAHARGRPGYALQLAAGEGANAVKLAQEFLTNAQSGSDLSRIIGGLTGKGGDERWPIFRDTFLASLSDAARRGARGMAISAFGKAGPDQLLDAWQSATNLIARGEAVNLDRAQMLVAISHDLRLTLGNHTA